MAEMLETPGAVFSAARHCVALAGYFSLLVQRKVTKRKDTRSTRRSLTGSLLSSKNPALRNSRYAPH
jgi:hypothetical protein